MSWFWSATSVGGVRGTYVVVPSFGTSVGGVRGTPLNYFDCWFDVLTNSLMLLFIPIALSMVWDRLFRPFMLNFRSAEVLL